MKKVIPLTLLLIFFCKKPANQALDANALKQSSWVGIDRFSSTVLTFDDTRVKYEINMEGQACGSAAYTIKGNTVEIGATEACKGVEGYVGAYAENAQSCTYATDEKALEFKVMLKCASFSAGRRDSQVLAGQSVKLGERELVSMGSVGAQLTETAVFRSEPDSKSAEVTVEHGDVIRGPGTKSTVLPKDGTVILLARTKEKQKVQSWENYWYYVIYYGTQANRGWVFGEFVKTQ